jgi:CRP-like cAMP-binding protein
MRTTKAQRRANRQRLATLELFASCTTQQLDGIARLATDIDVGEGTRLCREHRTAPQFVIVVDGHVGLFRAGNKVGVVHQGGWFGHAALLDDQFVEDVTAIASETTRVLVFSRQEFTSLLDLAPGVRNTLARPVTVATPDRKSALVEVVSNWLARPAAVAPQV